LEELAVLTYQWTNEKEAPVIQAMKNYGIVFIDEASGLRNDLFRQSMPSVSRTPTGW